MEHLREPVVWGAVSLIVRDLSRCVAYYRDAIGLEVYQLEGALAHLGAGGRTLIILEEHTSAVSPGRTTGLYHTAFLLPTRADLARQLKHIVDRQVLLDGMSDHLVSEALYLSDPEGNGIEIYADRPREEWAWIDGEIAMTTTPMDVGSVMAELGGEEAQWRGIPSSTIIGHVHFRVSNLSDAEVFYREILGFEVTTNSYPEACFLSRHKYHHHVGLNIWRSAGAPPRPSDAPGLHYAELLVEDARQYNDIFNRSTAAGAIMENLEAGFIVKDPSGNGILVKTFNAVAETQPAHVHQAQSVSSRILG